MLAKSGGKISCLIRLAPLLVLANLIAAHLRRVFHLTQSLGNIFSQPFKIVLTISSCSALFIILAFTCLCEKMDLNGNQALSN